MHARIDFFFHFPAVILILLHESYIIFTILLLECHFGYLRYIPVDLLYKLRQCDYMGRLSNGFLSLLHAFFQLGLHFMLENGRSDYLPY